MNIEPKAVASGIPVYCAHDEIVDIMKVIPNPKNPNMHPERQIEILSQVIKAQGWRKPITVSKRSGFVVAGHGRLQAALLLKVDAVPVDYQDYANEAEEYADLIADNRISELSEIDHDLLNSLLNEIQEFEDFNIELTGYSDYDIDSILSDMDDLELLEESEAIEDDYEVELPAEPKAKLGDIYQLGKHRLMCGDSTKIDDVEKLMDGIKADMVFTDPPYNCNYGNIKHSKFKQRHIENDNMSTELFYNFCTDFIENIKMFCRGCVYMCAGQGADGRVMFSVADKILHNSTTIIWNKDQFTLGRGKYQNKYEPIWFGWVESGIDFTDDRTLTNVWDINRPKKSELHPTMKPVEIVSTAMEHNPKSKNVLDLFGGSGTTLIAGEQTNRKCYVMELDPKYVDVIIDRWEKFTGEKAVLLNAS